MEQAAGSITLSAPAKTMSDGQSAIAAAASGPTPQQREVEAHRQSLPSDDQTHYQGARVGRNDPCPCGSGKKFKRCHGA